MSEPTWRSPVPTRLAPIQSTATLDPLMSRFTIGEHRRHQPARPQRGGGEVGVGLAEPLRLLGLADEGPHDADAGDLLAEHPVDLVDLVLHLAERRHHLADDRPEHDGGERHGDHQHDRQADVLPQGHDHADHDA